MVFHIKWSLDDGYVEAWKNGMHVTPFNGKDHKVHGSTVYNKVGRYLKIGLYRSSSITTTNVVYFDEIRIGESYAEVAP